MRITTKTVQSMFVSLELGVHLARPCSLKTEPDCSFQKESVKAVVFPRFPPQPKVSNPDQLFFSTSAIMLSETSSSSLSFRFSELSQSILSFLSLASPKGIFDEKDNFSFIDELARHGWNLCICRLRPGRN